MKISYLSHVPFFCEGVQFSRGNHVVTDAQLAQLMKNPIFNMRIRKGDFLIENLKDVQEKHVPSKSNDTQSEEIKLAAIRNATDAKGVKELVKEETSKTILAEAERKLEELDDNEKKTKEKRSGLKKAKEEAQNDEFKKEAFEKI